MSKKKYIDADKLINELKALPEQERLEYMGVYDCIKSMTTTNVAEVRRGEWIGDRGGENRVYDDFKCSICGKYTTIANRHRLDRYCGNCGAKMF